MILKISPTTDLGAELLRVDEKTGDIYLRVPSGTATLAAWVQTAPGQDLADFAASKKSRGKWLTVLASGTVNTTFP